MRKLLTILTVALTILSSVSHAQIKDGKVAGIVTDGSAKTIESATITLLRVNDSSVAKLSIANKTGEYSFDAIPEGKYQVVISAVGHQKGYSEIFGIDEAHKTVTLKTIELVPQASFIGGVTVTAKKPLIEQKIDRTIVNVEASVTNVGNSALDVLEKSPGISVDKDGNISLKGKQGVQVYIDGRPSYLSGADLANLLRSMSSSQLEQIEIMTNPPAKYDAAGNSGIINIKTKKNKQFGYNGSINSSYGQAKYPTFSESANFNYRSGKINVFSNVGYYYNHHGERLYINRNFLDEVTKDVSSKFDQLARMQNKNNSYNGKIGLDYSASKKTTLGVVVNGYYNPSTWMSSIGTDIFDPQGNLTSKAGAYTENREKWKNFSTNLNFRHVFDSTGQELTADFDYIQYRSTSKQPLISSYYDNGGNLTSMDTLLGDLPQDITIYSGKMDYSKPLKKDARFEAGIKSSYVKTDNNANYDSLQNGQIVHDFNRSNHFVYQENINAAYVNLTKPFNKKWSGQIGLRLENTIAKGNQLTTGVEFKRNYTQLFPTAYLQYTLNEKNQFVINYGRRINRPDYGDLNPFIHFLDRYTFEQGNPNLKPQFSHNIELSHTYGGFLTSTLNYSVTNDIIQQVLEQNEATHETFMKRANIASRKQIGLSISGYKKINKWWSGNVYFNVYNNHFKGIVNNDFISLGITGWMAQAQQQFDLGKGWSSEVSGFYRTKALEGVLFIKSIGQMNVGFSKKVLKGQGTIRLNFRDVFNGSKFRGYSRYGTVDAEFENINYNRSYNIGFNWRFNKGKLKAGSSRRTDGASDEQSRVKGGN